MDAERVKSLESVGFSLVFFWKPINRFDSLENGKWCKQQQTDAGVNVVVLELII